MCLISFIQSDLEEDMLDFHCRIILHLARRRACIQTSSCIYLWSRQASGLRAMFSFTITRSTYDPPPAKLPCVTEQVPVNL